MGEDPKAILGTTAKYIAESRMDMKTLHQIGEDIGAPTDTFDNGTNIRVYQAASRGLRHYNNKLRNLTADDDSIVGDVSEDESGEVCKVRFAEGQRGDGRVEVSGGGSMKGGGGSMKGSSESHAKESSKLSFCSRVV